jgi:hypothetical protein
MKFYLRAILIWIALGVVVFSPMYIYQIYKNAKVVYYSNQYSKVHVKVDSIYITSATSSDGGSGPNYYHFYNRKYNTTLSLLASNGSISELLGERHSGLDVDSELSTHNDSIWIWYHPKSEPSYAIETDKQFSIRKNISYLIVNGILLSFSIYAVTWQINFNKKKKQNQANL